MLMPNIPVRNTQGGLDCPRCGTTLVRAKAPFFIQSEFVGLFDSILCEMCNYSALTSHGYIDMTTTASKYGLIGSQEEEVEPARITVPITTLPTAEGLIGSPEPILIASAASISITNITEFIPSTVNTTYVGFNK